MKGRVTLLDILICLVCLGVVAGSAMLTFAATVNLPVIAIVPSLNNLTVTLLRAPAGGGNWTSASSIDFGTLTFDNTNKIFKTNWYYAADVGTESNADWTITHTRSSINNATLGDDLDDNVNVVFVKKGVGGTNETELDKVTFANSNNKGYIKSAFAGGYWLRIYYGVATGNVTTDAPGASPIGLGKPAGKYQGTSTITMSP